MNGFIRMRATALLLLATLINTCAYSQVSDTTKILDSTTSSTTNRNYSMNRGHGGKATVFWEVKNGNNVMFKKSSFVNTEIIERISLLESQECEALRKRDSLRLMTLWTRDFTLDETQSLVSSKGGIPYYTALYRMVEEITPIDSVTVITTGIEYQQQIGDFHTEEQKKKFFHIWTKQYGIWRLSTKRLE